MTPEFSRAVDPVFLYALDLLERIHADANVSPAEERAQIQARLSKAEALLGQSEDWELAKYALATWVDEILIEAPWAGAEWWKGNTLEWEYFKTADAHEAFYVRAKEASPLRKKDALEVYYICTILGFRGLYRDLNQAPLLADRNDLPPDLETWTKQTSTMIQLGRGRPPITESLVAIGGAPPLDGPFTVIRASLLGLILLLADIVVGLSLFW